MKKFFTCPNNAHARESWIRNQLESIKGGKTILDAGCGTQTYKKYCNHLNYKAQDFDQYNGGDGKGLQNENWNYGKLDYIGDIWAIDEKDESFDIILCTEVLEHVPYPNETIKEFSRLLKRGGVILLTAPFCSLPHMTPYYFYNGFSAADWYKKVAELNGLEIVSIEPNGNAFDYIAQETARSTNFVKNSLWKFVYKVFVYSTFLPLMKFFSRLDKQTQDYLHFGYHVKLKKL